jgi:hypothetical protein
MTLITLFMTLTGFAFAGAMDKEFACYTQMNSSTRAENVVMDNKVAIQPIDDFSFYKVTSKSVEKCTVPSKASLLDPGDAAGPKLVKIFHDKVPYHIQYPQVEEHTALKGSPAWLKAECSSSSDKKTIAKILENRISDSRQACKEGPKMADCLADFVDRLKSCEGLAAVRDYVMEIGRSAKIHARPPGSGSGGGVPAVGR